MSYEDMSAEDKIITAIGFVARGVTIPTKLRSFLEEQGLYEAIINPAEVEIAHDDNQGYAGRHQSCIL